LFWFLSGPTITQSEIFATIKPGYSNHAIASGVAYGLLTADDAALIREFIAEKRASVGICTGSGEYAIIHSCWLETFIGPCRELTIGDVYAGIDALKSGKSQKGKPFKQNTLSDHVVFLKRFLLWAIENGYSTLPDQSPETPSKDTITKEGI